MTIELKNLKKLKLNNEDILVYSYDKSLLVNDVSNLVTLIKQTYGFSVPVIAMPKGCTLSILTDAELKTYGLQRIPKNGDY